jgi:Zn-dependent peptidase ImmA (M78 family)
MNMPANKAKEILDKHWDRSIPVDVVRLARRVGANVIEDMSLESSGYFSVPDGNPVIRYNANEPHVRQRFTIAHELGHFLLSHGNSFRDGSEQYSSTNYDIKEVQANQFAAEVLMPESAVKFFIMEKGLSNIDDLARSFNVSQAAMMFRLKNLGWIT